MIQIDAAGAEAGSPYVQALKLNGYDYRRCWIPWDAVSGGASLEFTVAAEPDKTWAAGPEDGPPSFGAQ